MAISLTLGFFLTVSPFQHSAGGAIAQSQNFQPKNSIENVFTERPSCETKFSWTRGLFEDCSTRDLWDSVSVLDTPQEVTAAIVTYFSFPKWSRTQERSVDEQLRLLVGEVNKQNYSFVRDDFLRIIVKYKTTDQMVLAMTEVMSFIVAAPSILVKGRGDLVSRLKKSFIASQARTSSKNLMSRGFDSWSRTNKLSDLKRLRISAILEP